MVHTDNIPSVQDTSVLSPGLHIGLILTLAFIIFKKSSSHLFEHHPCLYLLTFGMVISKISNKLVVRSCGVAGVVLMLLGLLLCTVYFHQVVVHVVECI